MKHIRLLTVCVGLVFLGSSLAPAQSGGLTYSVTDLGAYLTGSSITWSIAYAINEGDQVVGDYMDGKDQYCFLYTPGTGAISFSNNTPKWCEGRAINILGDVAGTIDLGRKNAFSREANGTFHTHSSPWDATDSFGYGISYWGEVVGMSTNYVDECPTRWSPHGPMTFCQFATVGTFTGTSQSAAYLTISLDTARYRVFSTTPGYLLANNTRQELPLLACPPDSFQAAFPAAVNDNGDSVGWSRCGFDADHAVMWANGIIYDWGAPPSQAYAISNQYWSEAWIVGWTGYWGGDHAFLANLSCPAFVDLNTLLDSSSRGWTITHAYGVNASHRIVGQAVNSKGEKRAVLLTPNNLPLC